MNTVVYFNIKKKIKQSLIFLVNLFRDILSHTVFQMQKIIKYIFKTK